MNRDLITQAFGIAQQLVTWRQDFHQHPELGFEEKRTATRIAQELEKLRFRVRTGIGGTGVIGEFGSGKPKLAIRADMDALPIDETNPVPYRSRIPGRMHACGHDAHIAIALGAARLLAENEFSGTIRILFQPAEEIAGEDGLSGAPRMIKEGAMEDVEAIFALHFDPSLNTGDIGLISGVASAEVDTFYVTIKGAGGHGAMPHKTIDPILLSGHVILAIHSIVSRRLYPFDPAVISIGSIHGGEADNVIPDTVEMKGTIRYMDVSVQEAIHRELERALSICKGLGGDFALRLESGYPPVYNDPAVVDHLKRVASELLGVEHVRPHKIQMGAEDFSFMAAQAPGAIFSLGCKIEQQERKLHSSDFDLNEGCLPIGAAILSKAVLDYSTNR